jgi:ubiquitin-protein ligase
MSSSSVGVNRLFAKRIASEISGFEKNPLSNIDVYVDESNMHNWYFLIIGDKESDYNGGIYLGNLILSENYPTTPVDFVMLTPSGRFEIGRKICLTITGFHSDQWSASWTIERCLMAFSSIMVADVDSGLAHIPLPKDEAGIKSIKEKRQKLANESQVYALTHHSEILKNFKRFIKTQDSGEISFRTIEEIESDNAEFIKLKEEKKRRHEEKKKLKKDKKSEGASAE